ncbi:MAG: O-antigen polymerase [Candidatus Helarchaeota archaeon]
MSISKKYNYLTILLIFLIIYLINSRYLIIYGLFGGDSLWRASRIAEVIKNNNITFIYKDGYSLYIYYSIMIEIIGVNSFEIIGLIASFISIIPYLFMFLIFSKILKIKDSIIFTTSVLFFIFYFWRGTIILTQTGLSLLFMFSLIYCLKESQTDLRTILMLFAFIVCLVFNQMIISLYTILGMFILSQLIIIFGNIKRNLYFFFLTFLSIFIFFYWNILVVNSFEIIQFVLDAFSISEIDYTFILLILGIMAVIYSCSFVLRKFRMKFINNRILKSIYKFLRPHFKIMTGIILVLTLITYLLVGYYASEIGAFISLSSVRSFTELIIAYLPYLIVILIGFIGILDILFRDNFKKLKNFLICISFLLCFIFMFILIVLTPVNEYYSPLVLIPYILLFLSIFGFRFLFRKMNIYKKITIISLIMLFCSMSFTGLFNINQMRQSFPPVVHELQSTYWLKSYSNKTSHIGTDFRYMGIIIYSGINTLDEQYIGWQIYQFAYYKILFSADNISDNLLNILKTFHPPSSDHSGIDYIFIGNSMMKYECYCLGGTISKIDEETAEIYQTSYFNKIYDDYYNNIFSFNF